MTYKFHPPAGCKQDTAVMRNTSAITMDAAASLQERLERVKTKLAAQEKKSQKQNFKKSNSLKGLLKKNYTLHPLYFQKQEEKKTREKRR
jgi:hypothetical protein